MNERLADRLQIPRGLTSVIGSGGKTTLLRVLSGEVDGTVLLCTSTHILPFPDVPLYTGNDPDVLRALLHTHRVVCAGVPVTAPDTGPVEVSPEAAPATAPDTGPVEVSGTISSRKLRAPAIPFSVLVTLADYVLVEADGSKRLPLKAHAPYEPVIPAETKQTVLVVGASGIGKTVADAVHRPEIFCDLTGLSPADTASPEAVVKAIRREQLAGTIFISQVDTPARQKAAQLLAAQLADSFRVSVGRGLCAP